MLATDLSSDADPGALAAPLAHALAAELVALNSVLAELAYDLGSDEATLRRHMTALQAIDRITQTQMAIADVLRSDAATPDRIAAITLEDLAVSLKTRMAAPVTIA